MAASTSQVTHLLQAWRDGDPAAPEKLMPLVYDELRRIARRRLARERAGHTLQTTALVNEAYLRIVKREDAQWNDRVHFFALAARVMRQLLVDHARRRGRKKRGGGEQDRVSLNAGDIPTEGNSLDVLALHEALDKLAALDPRKSQLVELRYFGGLSAEETAEALGVSAITVKREWLKAKAWLYRELRA
jgi:RNA polymerase sigma factor (TIGR02999 family)